MDGESAPVFQLPTKGPDFCRPLTLAPVNVQRKAHDKLEYTVEPGKLQQPGEGRPLSGSPLQGSQGGRQGTAGVAQCDPDSAPAVVNAHDAAGGR